MESNKKSGPALLVLALFAAAGLGLVSINIPFGRDQGVAAYVARVISEGGAVYKDVFHFNLPGVFFTYFVVSGLPVPWGVNLLHVVFTALCVIAVYAAAKRMMSARRAGWAALFFGAFAAVMYTDYWDIAQKESLASLPLALCLLFYLRQATGGGLANSLMAGIFAGLAAQYKPTLGIVVLAAPLAALKARPGRPAAPTAAAAAGFIISFVPLLVHLVAAGALSEMLDSVFRFGSFYGGQYYKGFMATFYGAVKGVALWAYEWRFLITLAAGGVVLGRGKPEVRTVTVFAALLLVQVIVQMKFFTYHWIALLGPVSILAALGGGELMDRLADAGKTQRRLVMVILAALLVGNLAPRASRYRRELLYDLGMITQWDFLKAYAPWGKGDICPAAQRAAASYVKERTRPDQPVLVWGHEAAFYLLAGRFPPTRFAYDQPLTADPGGNEAFARYRERLRAEFISDLKQRPPAYIVVIEGDATGIEPEDSYTQMKSFVAFDEYIEESYALETKIEHYFIFARVLGKRGAP